MKSKTKKVVIGVAVAAVVAVAVALVLYGVLPTSSDAHPPCDTLPTAAAAASALDGNRGLADEIEALGEGITVEVGKPCPEGEDRALITVTYRSGTEHDAVRGLLMERGGFGVPVHLEER